VLVQLPTQRWIGMPLIGAKLTKPCGGSRRVSSRQRRQGRWGKVKALQHLLTHSFSGKALAVRRVTENQGKWTPGVDGITWNTSEQKATAIQTLRQRGYRPQPLRRLYIPKKNGKKRPLSIPVMQCRAMQALYLLALQPIAETLADPNSYGFRPERSTADAIEQCFNGLAKKASPQWIFEGDIAACFDRISHDWLLAHVPRDTTMLRKWLKAGFMDHRLLYPTETGTPQGGIISPVLANLALDGLEAELRKAFPRTRTNTPMVNLVRYADDFLITGRSKALLEEEVQPLVERFLKKRGLELSAEKTKVTHIEEGFDFLGQHLRKYPSGQQVKLLITPAKREVHELLGKVRGIIKANKQLAAGKLILLLNPILRGWAQYHQHVASKATYGSIDDAIYQTLKRWVKRRHPGKAKEWIAKKYFKTIGGDNWVFHGEVEGKEVHLVAAASIPITRHAKVKAEANPFDPHWEVYFEHRLGVKMADNLRGRRQLLYLWREQNGLCPVCAQKITKLTGWHNHHRNWRSKGGLDTADNRVLLHPTCHNQVHSQGLYVEKPRPSRGERKA
jgi:RNA-directed DNA polymerase